MGRGVAAPPHVEWEGRREGEGGRGQGGGGDGDGGQEGGGDGGGGQGGGGDAGGGQEESENVVDYVGGWIAHRYATFLCSWDSLVGQITNVCRTVQLKRKGQVAIGLVRGLLKRSSVEIEGQFILSSWVRNLQTRLLNEIQLDESFNFQGSWFEIETGEAVSILYLEGGEAVKNGEDKRYHCC